MVISQDDVGRRVLLKRLYVSEADKGGYQKALWDGDWELFGIRFDGRLVVKQLSGDKIIEIRFDPLLMRIVGPKMSGA